MDIKPCPFCGSDEVTPYKDRWDCWTVVCEGCDAAGPEYYDKDKAKELWNKAPRPGIAS